MYDINEGDDLRIAAETINYIKKLEKRDVTIENIIHLFAQELLKIRESIYYNIAFNVGCEEIRRIRQENREIAAMRTEIEVASRP